MGWGYEIGCQDEACMWFNQGCTADCSGSTCDGLNTGYAKPHCDDPNQDYEPFITNNMTEYLTYPMSDYPTAVRNVMAKHPWRYPGIAPVFDSCGISSGSSMNNTAAGGFNVPGFDSGYPASKLPVQDPNSWNQWIAGSVAQVAMGLRANHGGGYQYRLCPADSDLNEACFQSNPLQYVNNTSTLFWIAPESGKASTPLTINATRLEVNSATNVWTKNPVPAYNCFSGGAPDEFVHKPGAGSGCAGAGPQFTPPEGLEDGYWGFFSVDTEQGADVPSGETEGEDPQSPKWLPFIGDYVRVPDTAGHYILSWRWDSEQTPQVWTNCADIYISSSSSLLV